MGEGADRVRGTNSDPSPTRIVKSDPSSRAAARLCLRVRFCYCVPRPMARRKRAFCPGTALPDWPLPDNEFCRRASACAGAAEERRMLHRVFACLIALAMTSLPSAAQEQTITVFAAASLQHALDDGNARFTKHTRR